MRLFDSRATHRGRAQIEHAQWRGAFGARIERAQCGVSKLQTHTSKYLSTYGYTFVRLLRSTAGSTRTCTPTGMTT